MRRMQTQKTPRSNAEAHKWFEDYQVRIGKMSAGSHRTQPGCGHHFAVVSHSGRTGRHRESDRTDRLACVENSEHLGRYRLRAI